MVTKNNMLGVEQVAEQLGLTVHQVYRRINRGDLVAEVAATPKHERVVSAAEVARYKAAGMPLTPPRREGRMLRVPEVCKLIGYSDVVVRQLCEKGVLNGRRNGDRGHYRITRESVERYLDTFGGS